MLRRRNVGANGGGGATEDAGEEDKSIANPASPPFIEEVPSDAASNEVVKPAAEAEDAPKKEAESEAKEPPAKAAVRRADPRLRALLIEALTQGKCPRAYVLFSPSGIREFVEILPPPEVHGREPASVVDEMLEGQGDSHDWTFGLALPKTPEGQEGKLIIGGIILDIEAMGGQSATLGMRASKFVKWLALPPANGNLADRNSPWCFNGLHVLVGLGAWLVVCLCHGLYKGRGLTSTLSLQAPGRKVLEEQLERNLASIPVPEDSPLYTQYRKYYMDEFQKLAAQTEAFRPTAQKGVGAFSLHSLLDVHMDWQAFLQTFSNGVIVLFVLAILSSFVRVYILPGGSSPQGFWSWALQKMKTGEETSAKATAAAAATAAAPASSPQESEEAEEAVAAEVPEREEAKPARPVPAPLAPTVEEAEPGPATVSLSPTSEVQHAPAVPDDAALPLAPVPAASTGQKQGLPFILEGPNGEPMVVHLPLPSARAPEAPSPTAQAAEKQPAVAASQQQPRIDYGASPQRQKLQRKIAAREQKAQPPRVTAPSTAAAPVPVVEELAASGDDPLGDEVAVEALLRELEGTPKVSKKKRNSLQKQPAQGRTPKGASAKGQQEAEVETFVEELPRQSVAKVVEPSEPVLPEPSTDRGAAAEEAAAPAPAAAASPAAGSGKRKGAQAAKEQASSPPAQQELKPEAKSKQGKPVAAPTVVPQSQASPTAARKAKVAPPAAADVQEQPGPAASQRPKSKPSNPSGSDAGRSPAAPKPAAVQRTESQDQPHSAEAEPLLEGGDGEWDIALSRSTRRRSRASTDASAGPPASPGMEIAEPAPSPGSEVRQPQTPPAGQNGSEKGSRSKASNGSKQTPANRTLVEEAPTLPECSNFIAAHSPEACKPMDGAAEAVLDELKQMRKDELLRWFNANSALGWLHDRLTGAQIMECTPKSVLLDHAALLLGSAASAQKEAEKAAREPLQAKREEAQEGDGPCEAAASPAPPTSPPAVAPIPAASLAPTAAARGAVAATPMVPVRPPVAAPLVPAMPAPLKAAPKAWAAVAGKAAEAVSPLVPPPRVVAGAVEETPIRFGDFEPPPVPPPAPPPSQSEQPDTAAGPPSQASDNVEGAAAGHPCLAAQDPSHGACLSKEALLQQQQLQQQHPMMVMQPTLTAGGMMLPCMPGMAPMMGFAPGMQANQWQHPEAPMMGFVPNMQANQWQVPEAGQAAPAVQGNPPAQQGAENQAGCQRLMPNMPGADVLGMQQAMAAQQAAMSGKQVMPFVPFMPAMAGAAGMGQQAMQQQFLPVMFAVPFNAVSQEGGAAGNMQGMMVPMPMAATGEFGGAMSCGTVPAGMSTQQAAAMGMPFASASEAGAGSCVNIKSSQNT